MCLDCAHLGPGSLAAYYRPSPWDLSGPHKGGACLVQQTGITDAVQGDVVMPHCTHAILAVTDCCQAAVQLATLHWAGCAGTGITFKHSGFNVVRVRSVRMFVLVV